MKKNLIAIAVAGVMAAPMAAVADINIYGQLNFELQSWDGDIDTASNGSRLGFKGSEDLGGGMSAIWQIEGAIDPSLGGQTLQTSNRNTFLGLTGDFGTLLLGRHDHPYKLATLAFRPMGDTMADQAGFNAESFLRSDGVVAYVSPNMNGFSFAAAAVPFHAGSNEVAYSISATYNADPILVTAAYDKLDDAGLWNATMLGARYNFGMGTIGLMYEDIRKVNRREAFTLPVTFNIDGGMYVRAMAKKVDWHNGGDATDFALQVGKNMSNRTEMYGIVTTTNDNDDANFALGLRHRF